MQYRPNAPIPSAVPPPPQVEQTPYGSVLPPASDWLKWLGRLANRPELDVAPNPLGVGVGVVRGTTPAAEGLANFVRRVWPSLGRKADELPDITLRYGGPGKSGQTAWYSYPDSSYPGPAKGASITIPRELLPAEPPFTEASPTNAHQAVKSYLHELLHAIYDAKGYAGIPPHGKTIWKGTKHTLTPERRELWKGRPEHGAIDAMAVNIWRKRLGDPKGKIVEGMY